MAFSVLQFPDKFYDGSHIDKFGVLWLLRKIVTRQDIRVPRQSTPPPQTHNPELSPSRTTDLGHLVQSPPGIGSCSLIMGCIQVKFLMSSGSAKILN